jgi:anti-sigma regulatory factor (Ser/Thr protein kinase)
MSFGGVWSDLFKDLFSGGALDNGIAVESGITAVQNLRHVPSVRCFAPMSKAPPCGHVKEQPGDRSIAAALQRVLLPAGLPDVDGWAVATLYEPAGEAVLVGGDFYDWLTLPNGHVLFLVGDVSGKGPLSGALGMSIRKALKGMSWVTDDVFAALPQLEQALAEEFADAFATFCMLELTPGSGGVRVLLAGHPPPWLRGDGTFSEVVAPENGLLGPGLQRTWESVNLQVQPGGALFVFTDGLSEARLPDGSLFGEGSLGRFLDALPPNLSSFETVLQADAHLRRTSGPLLDDLIIAVLTFAPPTPPAAHGDAATETLNLRLPPRSTSASAARRFVRECCAAWRLDEAVQQLAELITSELVTNAVLHARTDLELTMSKDAGQVHVGVRDDATTVPARAAVKSAAADPEQEHGRGLALLTLLGADVHVVPTSTGKIVWASLRLDAAIEH